MTKYEVIRIGSFFFLNVVHLGIEYNFPLTDEKASDLIVDLRGKLIVRENLVLRG